MATINFYLNIRRIKKDGTYPLKLLVRHNDKFLVSTSFSATEEEWSVNQFVKSAPNSRAKNVALRNLINTAENVVFELERAGRLKGTTEKELKQLIEAAISNKPGKAVKRFIDYLDEFVARKTNSGTKSVYTTTRNKIEEFDGRCTFETMDKKWLERFEAWMAEGGMKVNAYAIHLRNIRAVFNYAIDEEYTTLYPFRRFSIKKEETRKRSLTCRATQDAARLPM